MYKNDIIYIIRIYNLNIKLKKKKKRKIYSRIRENAKLSSVKPETKEERRVSQTETWKVNQREFSHCTVSISLFARL